MVLFIEKKLRSPGFGFILLFFIREFTNISVKSVYIRLCLLYIWLTKTKCLVHHVNLIKISLYFIVPSSKDESGLIVDVTLLNIFLSILRVVRSSERVVLFQKSFHGIISFEQRIFWFGNIFLLLLLLLQLKNCLIRIKKIEKKIENSLN